MILLFFESLEVKVLDKSVRFLDDVSRYDDVEWGNDKSLRRLIIQFVILSYFIRILLTSLKDVEFSSTILYFVLWTTFAFATDKKAFKLDSNLSPVSGVLKTFYYLIRHLPTVLDSFFNINCHHLALCTARKANLLLQNWFIKSI